MTPQFTPESVRISRRPFLRIFLYVCAFLLSVVVTLYYTIVTLNTPTDNFPVGTDITIEEGASQRAIAELLEAHGVVRSSLFLQVQFRHYFKDTFVQAGVYRFEAPLTSLGVAKKLTEGQDRSPQISITLPEGFKANDLYQYLPERFRKEGVRDLSSYEGHLFPDTYFITPSITLEEILVMLTKTFDDKLKPYEEKIANSGFTKEEILILASLVEREAKDLESKKIVAGILRNRLRTNMPLQVDATFDYILGKASHELTDDDLEVDSPYNSYNNEGLPPTPIANPGLDSIEAVLEPTQTNYLYYLTGDDGTFHYAQTFEEHKKNKVRYIH